MNMAQIDRCSQLCQLLYLVDFSINPDDCNSTSNIICLEAGLSPGFLAEWWKWPSSTPVPSSLGYLPRVENPDQNKTSSLLFSMIFKITDKAT